MRRVLGMVCLWAAACVPAAAQAPDFDREIAPLIARRCLGCHAGEEPQGKLDLTRREGAKTGGESGPAIVPNDLSASQLWQRIEADEMPPKHPLPANERLLLRAWLLAGATWGPGAIDPLKYTSDARAGYDWWSLQPLQAKRVPVDPSSGARNAVDGFIRKRLVEARLPVSAEAERRVLIRRLSFDLIGLPPTPAEVEQFVNDPAPDAYEQLVDRLLASPHYGERWARHWLDVVRFGESNGFERDLPRETAWHYRDWVIEALNRDLPYDEFVRWQLAADSIAPEDAAAQAALGFLVAGPHDTVVPVSVRMRQTMRHDEMEDLIGVVSQSFLGLTVNCARCHDHKFDPISAKEYYQLAAVFAGVDHVERTITPAQDQRQLDAWQREIADLEGALKEQAQPIMAAIVTERSIPSAALPTTVLPAPVAQWDFTTGLRDRVGSMHGQWHGVGKQTSQGIEVDGMSHVATAPLTQDLVAKTLEARVKLADLEQRGGGVISLQTIDGNTFDAIVFGEQQPQRWLAGSNGFVRTSSLEGAAEEHAAAEFVTIAIVYGADGSVTGYRNGQLYGRGYASSGPMKFSAGEAQLVFGLRHGSPGGNRMLQGTISGAKLYDRALSAEEIAASAAQSGVVVTEADILARLPEPAQRQRRQQGADLVQLREQHASLAKSAPYKIYTAGVNQPSEMHVLRRGNVADPGDVVAPAGLSAVVGLPGDLGLRIDALERQRRDQLAKWITDRRNPLFARVMANRLWHYHFGAGLVATPNDLGFNGGRPSHPELLEWLASELVNSGFSLKHMHRLLVTSATYRQSSQHRPAAAAVDADNRLLWRMSPRRLDAESLRDAMLTATGELNTALGGKGYVDFNSYFFKGTQFYDPVDATGYETQRRTIYRMWARGGRNPFLDTFDCPDPSTTTPKRSATTTPLQALSLLNNAFSRRMAETLAVSARSACGNDRSAQVDYCCEHLFARTPSNEERAFITKFVEQHGLSATCRGLMNSSEFLYVD